MNCKYKSGGFYMGDLSAAGCGCGCGRNERTTCGGGCNTGCMSGNNSCLWIILILLFCGGCGGNSFGGNTFSGNNGTCGCGCGCDNNCGCC